MSGSYEWVDFEQEKWSNQKLPRPMKEVLVVIESEEDGVPNQTCVGWLKYFGGDKDSPAFIIPGRGGTVLKWCDCLPDGFLWPDLLEDQPND